MWVVPVNSVGKLASDHWSWFFDYNPIWNQFREFWSPRVKSDALLRPWRIRLERQFFITGKDKVPEMINLNKFLKLRRRIKIFKDHLSRIISDTKSLTTFISCSPRVWICCLDALPVSITKESYDDWYNCIWSPNRKVLAGS